MYLYSISLANVLKALTDIYGTTIWHLFLVVGWLCLFLLVLFCWCCCFWTIFFIAHLGYLQHLRTSSKCSNSLLISSGVEHKVLVICVRVLITLYLDAKLWLLSHCRYWSVWVGFLYTFLVKVPSTLGVTKISKNGMEPSGPASSIVNLMDVSTVLICWKNSSLCDLFWITKVSSTISSPYPWRVQCSVNGSVLKSLHVNICYNWAHWWSHGSTFSSIQWS